MNLLRKRDEIVGKFIPSRGNNRESVFEGESGGGGDGGGGEGGDIDTVTYVDIPSSVSSSSFSMTYAL